MQALGAAPEVSRRVCQMAKPSGRGTPARGALAPRGWPNIDQGLAPDPCVAPCPPKAPSTPLATRNPPPNAASTAATTTAIILRFIAVGPLARPSPLGPDGSLTTEAGQL